MSFFILLQYPYDNIEIALCQQSEIRARAILHKHDAIGQTIPVIQNLLSECNLILSQVQAIGVNVGPGPYNTLRAILTMVNGIHHVTKIPLITSSALDLMSIEHNQTPHVIILQAFEQHVFYMLDNQPHAGTVDQLAQAINHQPQTLHAYGNGAIKYQEQLTKTCGSKLIFDQTISKFNSLETLARVTAQKYQANEYASGFAKPIYFEDLQKQS